MFNLILAKIQVYSVLEYTIFFLLFDLNNQR